MATTFNLIRHGSYGLLDQAIGGRAPHALSDAGRVQAERVAAALAARPVAALLASPVQRAQETAALIAARLGLAIETDADFAEIDFANWTGTRFAALAADPAWQAWNRFRSTAGIPGGETMLAVQLRAVSAIRRVAAARPDAEVAIVTHGDVIKAALMHFLGMPLDLLHRFEIGPCSTSRFVLYAESATVLSVNVPP